MISDDLACTAPNSDVLINKCTWVTLFSCLSMRSPRSLGCPMKAVQLDKSISRELQAYATASVPIRYEVLGVGACTDGAGSVAVFTAVDWCHAQWWRGSLGLPPSDLHITLGFYGQDVHGVPKGEAALVIKQANMGDFTPPTMRSFVQSRVLDLSQRTRPFPDVPTPVVSSDSGGNPCTRTAGCIQQPSILALQVCLR